jgi:hydroxymethylbilane synthase
LITPLHHVDTALCVVAERSMNAYLDGGCEIPLAAHATLDGSQLHLRGLVASPDGRRLIRAECVGAAVTGVAMGQQLGADLLAAGAAEILADLHHATA